MIVRKSTARTVLVGPILDADGVAKIDEVVGSIKVTKNGTVGVVDGAATLTHDHTGKYKLALTVTDYDTVGILEISLNSTTNAMPIKAMTVVEEAIYDQLFASGAVALPTASVIGTPAGADIAADIAAIPTVTEFNARTLPSADYFDPAADTVANVTLVATTTNLTNLPSIPANWLTAAGIAAGALDGKGNWNIGKTGYSLIQLFPTNFAALGINITGHVERVMLVDTTTTNIDMRGTNSAMLATANGSTFTAIPDMATAMNQSAIAGYIDTEVGTIITHLTDIKGATWSAVTDTLEGIRDRGDVAWITGAGGAGTGARTITVTVNDGVSPLENATVRFSEGVNTFSTPTNASGVATFNLDDATYTVALTKDGYTYGGSTLVVTADATPVYSMTAIVITPATNPAQSTLSITCYDDSLVPEPGAIIRLVMVKKPDGDVGRAYDTKVKVLTADSSGVVTVTVVRSAVYTIQRGDEITNLIRVTIPDTATCTVESVLGKEEL